jgi:hypothetical protein
MLDRCPARKAFYTVFRKRTTKEGLKHLDVLSSIRLNFQALLNFGTLGFQAVRDGGKTVADCRVVLSGACCQRVQKARSFTKTRARGQIGLQLAKLRRRLSREYAGERQECRRAFWKTRGTAHADAEPWCMDSHTAKQSIYPT